MENVTAQTGLPGPEAKRDHGPATLAFALAAIFSIVRAVSAGVLDSGDGSQHYLIARYAWRYAETGLDQWGKPLFSLLASPFAQCRPAGITVFNALCMAIAGVIIAYDRRVRGSGWAWAPPLLLFGCTMMAYTVLGGLTEPLFGLLSLVVFALLERGRYAWAMVLFSFLPFARPEYIAIAPFAIGYVCLHRRWSALPWIMTGTVVYSLASGLLLQRPWAFFQEHTYLGNGVYGQGDLLHFWQRREEILGTPLAWVTLVAILLLPLLVWRRRADARSLLAFCGISLLPALGIFALHSFAYWRGDMASMGLLRVMACAVPLLVWFIVRMLAQAWAAAPRARIIRYCVPLALVGYGVWAYMDLMTRLPLPIEPHPVQPVERAAAAYIRGIRGEDRKLIYISPHLGALCGADPWNASRRERRFFSMHDVSDAEGIVSGDLIAWDAAFGDNEGRTPLDSFLLDPRFRLLKSFHPSGNVPVHGGRAFAVHVFERTDIPQGSPAP